MRASVMMFRVYCCSLLLLLCATHALPAAEFTELASELRLAMAQRNFPLAAKKLVEVKEAAKTPDEKVTAERLDLLHGYLFEFWKSVHAGGSKLQGTDELEVGEQRVAVVEYNEEEGKLILRVQGQNKRYALKELPARLALVLSSQVLKQGAPENEAYIGTFLAMDGRGDRQMARDAWERAAKGGVDIKSLLPELEIDLPAGATIRVPTLTPETAAALRPQFWSLMQPTDKGWKPIELNKLATQNTSGQLEIKLPDDTKPNNWVVFKRKLPPNFGLRLYLQDLPAGQKLGLFVGKERECDAHIELPAGLVKVELARQQGKLICRINDKEQAVTVDDPAAKNSGTLGFTLPAAGTCQVAGFEFAK